MGKFANSLDNFVWWNDNSDLDIALIINGRQPELFLQRLGIDNPRKSRFLISVHTNGQSALLSKFDANDYNYLEVNKEQDNSEVNNTGGSSDDVWLFVNHVNQGGKQTSFGRTEIIYLSILKSLGGNLIGIYCSSR